MKHNSLGRNLVIINISKKAKTPTTSSWRGWDQNSWNPLCFGAIEIYNIWKFHAWFLRGPFPEFDYRIRCLKGTIAGILHSIHPSICTGSVLHRAVRSPHAHERAWKAWLLDNAFFLTGWRRQIVRSTCADAWYLILKRLGDVYYRPEAVAILCKVYEKVDGENLYSHLVVQQFCGCFLKLSYLV